MSAEELVDHAVLTEFGQQVGEANVRLLVRTMLADLAPALLRVERACADRDRDLLQREAHRLKGAVGSLGARGLSAHLLLVQLACAEGAWAELDALVSDAAACGAATEQVLREQYA